MIKKTLVGVVSIAVAFCLAGCSSWYMVENGVVKSNFTGNSYDAKTIYRVLKGGVTTYMTAEDIKAKGLDKINDVVITTYKLSQGNDVEFGFLKKEKN